MTLARGRFTRVRYPVSPVEGRVPAHDGSYGWSVRSTAAVTPARTGLAALVAAALAALAVAGSADGGARAWNAYLAPAGACEGAADVSASASTQIRAVTCLVNWARSQDRRSQLVQSPALVRAAALKGHGVASCLQFSHTPCGDEFTETIRRAGYRYSSAGENLYAGPWGRVTARDVVAAWLKSSGHRANILRPGFRHVGAAPVRAKGLLGQGVSVVWTADIRVTAVAGSRSRKDSRGESGNAFSCATRAISTTCARRFAATSSV